ncbi:MAG TPA: hypothetical protein VJN18_00655 [Polyangiaceae bacterium]|nr:hypothetical protein [Polyangiaceae bacterium]
MRYRPARFKPGASTFLLLAVSTSAAGLASCGDGDEPQVEQSELHCALKPSRTFRERIEPLLSSDRITTCNQCHLSGVDLSAFVRETPCKTWACLQEQQLVNVESPRDSRILGWIERASPDSELITKDVIAAERDAFLEWIEANAACRAACVGVECGAPDKGPTCGDDTAHENPVLPLPEDTRGCSDVELEQAFYDDIYTYRGRCYPCHFDTELTADPDAPRWISATGNCETGSAVTLARTLGLGLIDTETPSASLLLLKPLDDAGGGVMHGGDQKFAGTEDPTYVSFLRFIQHYADCKAGKL